MKKRVLLVTNGFPFGESERSFLSEEVKLLAEEFDLLVLAPENDATLLYPTDGILRIERFRFSSFRKNPDLRSIPHVFHYSALQEAKTHTKGCDPLAFLQNVRQTLYFRFNVWEMEQKIGELVQTEKIDLIYTYWCSECTLAAVYLKKRFPRLKVITRFHGMDLYEERADNGWQLFRKEIACGADGLCFACSYGKEYFLEHWGAEFAAKSRVFYLGSTDRGELESYRQDCLQIISCSNLIPLKQVGVIIEGLALLPEHVRVKWTLFGDGPEREQLEALARDKLGSHANISWQFRGFVPNAALTEDYRDIGPQLFITTSSTEGGAPVSIQEAFSMGIPAIGTAVGGIPDLIIDDRTGYLLPQNVEPAHVAAAILRFYVLPDEQKQQMSHAARQHWAEKFDAKKNAVQFMEYLHKLLAD